MNELENLMVSSISDLDATSVTLNFILCIAMSLLARVFYIRFSTSLTGKTSHRNRDTNPCNHSVLSYFSC